MHAKDSLQIVCAEGERQKVEFKAALMVCRWRNLERARRPATVCLPISSIARDTSNA
jgi:hypothetical protein